MDSKRIQKYKFNNLQKISKKRGFLSKDQSRKYQKGGSSAAPLNKDLDINLDTKHPFMEGILALMFESMIEKFTPIKIDMEYNEKLKTLRKEIHDCLDIEKDICTEIISTYSDELKNYLIDDSDDNLDAARNELPEPHYDSNLLSNMVREGKIKNEIMQQYKLKMEKSPYFQNLQYARSEFTYSCFVVSDKHKLVRKGAMDQTRKIIEIARSMSEKGDIYFRIVLACLDLIEISKNIIMLDLLLTDLARDEKLKEAFRTGITDTNINYRGTLYEHSKLKEYYVEDGIDKVRFLVDTRKGRNIYEIDYAYPSLMRYKMKNKMFLYQSTGTSYSAAQKGLLSSFVGEGLQPIIFGNPRHTKKYDEKTYRIRFRNCMIDIMNFLDPNFYKKFCGGVTRRFTHSGKPIYISYTYEEWVYIITEVYIYDWWIFKYPNYLVWNQMNMLQETETKYDDWENADEVRNLLGAEFVESSIKTGHLRRLGTQLEMKNVDDILKITEPLSSQDTKDLFFKRYHGSKAFFSLRNMASKAVITQKKILRRHHANLVIKDQNIFDKNFSTMEKDKKNIGNPNWVMYDIEKTINKKIISYFYDMTYYRCPDVKRDTFNDLEEVLTIYGYKFNLLTLLFSQDPRTGYYFFQDLNQIEEIVKILKTLAKSILEGRGEQYLNTIFYSYIMIPLYEEIINYGG